MIKSISVLFFFLFMQFAIPCQAQLIEDGNFETNSAGAFSIKEIDSGWRAFSESSLDWNVALGGNPGQGASLIQHKAAFFLASNKMSFADEGDYQLTFDFKQDLGGQKVDFYVGLSSTQDRGSMGQVLFQTSSFDNTYTNKKIDFKVADGGEYFVVFYTDNAVNKTVVNLFVDNIRIIDKNAPDPGTIWDDIEDIDEIDANFKNPPNEFRMIQYANNGQKNKAKIQEMRAYGIGGVQTQVGNNDNYLEDPKQFNYVKEFMNDAKDPKYDFQVWIHDEAGYPSGAAKGKVVAANEDYEARGLVRKMTDGSGTGNTTISFPVEEEIINAFLYPMVGGEPDYENAVAVSFTGNSVTTNGMLGSWRFAVFAEFLLDEATQAQSTMGQFGQTGHYPSLLNKEACAKFVEVTHQAYADYIGTDGLANVDAVYTGEANLMSNYWPSSGKAQYKYTPWEASVIAKFQEMHGYAIQPNMDALFSGDSDAAKTIRLHYFQTVAQLVSENYGGQITAWARDNGVKAMAHPLLEEYMIQHVVNYGDLLSFLRAFDFPGCDLHIGREDKKNWNWWMGKYISSAAYLDNKDTVMVHGLLDPVIGLGLDDLTPEIPILKRTVNANFLTGLNQFNSYMPYLGNNKNDTIGYTVKEYKGFNDYVGRIGSMLRGTWNEAPVAMYYPIATYQSKYKASDDGHRNKVNRFNTYQNTFDNLAKDMLTNGLDYNIVTDDVLLSAYLDGNALVVGKHRYYSLVMPYVDMISLELLTKIKAMSDAGFPVYWVDAKPSLGFKMSEHTDVKNLADGLQVTEDPIVALKDLKDQYTVKVTSSDSELRMTRFKNQKGYRLYYVTNDKNTPVTISGSANTVDEVRVYHPSSGVMEVVKLPFNRSLAYYDSFIIMEKIAPFDLGNSLSVDDTSEMENFKLKVYPNPVAETLQINLLGETFYQVLDQTGRLLLEGVYNDGIDVAELSKGLYILRTTTTRNQVQITRFVKK